MPTAGYKLHTYIVENDSTRHRFLARAKSRWTLKKRYPEKQYTILRRVSDKELQRAASKQGTADD